MYHLGSGDDILNFMNKEQSIMWTTHPRTKNSEGYPEAYKDKDFFLSDRWVGASWESLPGRPVGEGRVRNALLRRRRRHE